MATTQKQAQPQTTEPRILRVGVVQDSKIIEERLLRRRAPVTVGQSIKNTFCFPISKLPRSVTLFEVKNDRYELRFDEGLKGRVALDDKVYDLTELKAHKNVQKKGTSLYLPLDEKSRGKLVLDEITFLFQMVPPPPKRAKGKLPMLAQGWLKDGLKREYVLIVGMICSIFFQGGGLATSKALQKPHWMLNRPEMSIEVLAVDVEFKEEVQKEEEKKIEPEKKDDGEVAKNESPVESEPVPMVTEKQPEQPKPAGSPDKPRGPARPAAGTQANFKQRTAVALKKNTILGVLDTAGGGPSSPDAGPNAGKYASAFDPTGINTSATKEGFTSPVGPGGGGGGVPGGTGQLKGLEKGERTTTKLETGTVKKTEKTEEKKVNYNVKLSPVTAGGGGGKLDVASVNQVFRRRASAVRACYESRMHANSTLGGKIVIQFTISPAGRVTAISVLSNSTGDSQVASCITDKVKSWKFDEPENGSVIFTIPIVLSKG